MPLTDEAKEKIKQNAIIHHYEYPLLDKRILSQITALDKQRVELVRQLDAKITIQIPTPFAKKLISKEVLRQGAEVEWTTYVAIDGQQRQRRHVVYVERISDNAECTAIFDARGHYVSDISADYTKLECFLSDNEGVIRLSGLEWYEKGGRRK